MSEFVTRRLGDIVEVLDNKRVPLNEEQRSKMVGNIPYYGANGVQGFINKAMLDEPLILMAEDGGYFDDFVERPIAYKIEGPAWVNNHAHILRATANVNQDFLFYALQHKDIRRFIKGGTRAKLNASDLKDILVEIPLDTREQRGIAEVLSALDEQIEATEALISKKFLVRSAILTTLVKDAHASSVAIDLLASKVGSGVTPTGGSEVYTSSGVTFVRSQNVLNESLEFSDVAFITDETHAGMAASKLQVHDVLLNITGASIGRSCAVPEGIGEANVNQHVCIIRLHHPCKADAALLAALICSEFGQRELNRQISGGNREGLNYQQVRAMALPWPQDAAIRAEMASVIQAAKSEIEALEAELVKLQQQKQGLMHDLLSGKTRVLQ